MMADKDRPYYYRAVPGSRELVTSSGKDPVLETIERAAGSDPNSLRLYQGEWLGGVGLAAGVMVPASVFDALALKQTPVEQTVYLHLFRLSYGRGRNWCRAGKRELRDRSRLSDRRLNFALDGLVRKGQIKPLHRNPAGTLYRVYLPSEALGQALEPGVQFGKKLPSPETERKGQGERPPAEIPRRGPASPGPAGRARPLESPLNEERFADVAGKKPKGPAVAEMAEEFFRARGRKARPQDRQLAISVLTGLLEDGFAREEVRRALEWFAQNVPEEKSIERLPYFISRALEESGHR